MKGIARTNITGLERSNPATTQVITAVTILSESVFVSEILSSISFRSILYSPRRELSVGFFGSLSNREYAMGSVVPSSLSPSTTQPRPSGLPASHFTRLRSLMMKKSCACPLGLRPLPTTPAADDDLPNP